MQNRMVLKGLVLITSLFLFAANSSTDDYIDADVVYGHIDADVVYGHKEAWR